MKKLFLALGLLFLLTSTAFAAEGEGIKVAVIDSGISPEVIAPERIGGGYNYIRPQDGTGDKIGHGTAVAAIIVGMENGKITGICPSAQMVSLVYSSLDGEGKRVAGDTAMTAQAIYDAVDLYGCRIINISSGTPTHSKYLQSAVDYAAGKGVLVVACAGNGGGSELCYPGAYDSVLCVGACDETGALAGFSQDNDTVDLLARGTKLSVASLRGTRIRGEGTSFSTALVTGVAAQLWTRYPDLTAGELRELVLNACLTVEGRRVLDPARALAAVPDPAPESSETEPETPPVDTAPPDGEPVLPAIFADVPADAYYYDAVYWAAGKDITGGVDAARFVPGRACTRAQMVTFLWRAAGCPPVENSGEFTDVPADAYYATAVAWAKQTGITGGVEEGLFAPAAPCTRGQMAMFLYRLAGTPEVTGMAPFADVAEEAYYQAAVRWAAEQGITGGVAPNRFAPDAPCTRSQIVTFLYRYFAV